MGIENPNPSSSGINQVTSRNVNYVDTSIDQFFNITKHGEPPIKRQGFDNPAFLWPSNEYMDITGKTHKIQRGYLRSLITDPEVAINVGKAKNRRLFFQFNPQVLVRSVQQSVGAMNPLLQDPAQLAQPIPGTASFGFELLFNREHEVNSGENGEYEFPFSLPDAGGSALVSRVGVLADLMVLDTITGQGLSQDLVTAIASINNRNLQKTASELEQERKDAEDAGDDEFLKSYRPLEVPDEDTITKIFKNNIGNTAFLNPIPFRAVFSSLFMVEGIATSVDVKFTKFSRTMVPTMCTVTVNMYALYIGFAKKDTFLYNNLQQSRTDYEREKQKDQEQRNRLSYAISSVNISSFSFSNNKLYETIVTVRETPAFKESRKKKQIKDVRFEFSLNYKLSSTSAIPSDSALDETALFYYDSSSEIPIDKISYNELAQNTGFFPRLTSPELDEQLKKRNTSLDYLYGIMNITLIANSDNGNNIRVPVTSMRMDKALNVETDISDVSWSSTSVIKNWQWSAAPLVRRGTE